MATRKSAKDEVSVDQVKEEKEKVAAEEKVEGTIDANIEEQKEIKVKNTIEGTEKVKTIATGDVLILRALKPLTNTQMNEVVKRIEVEEERSGIKMVLLPNALGVGEADE